jgi:hypothetical protein
VGGGHNKSEGRSAVIVNSNIKISISDREREELIKNFKIGVLCQLQKEGYITEEQLNKMIRDINSATFADKKYVDQKYAVNFEKSTFLA